jgi:hypothetical protein
MNPLKLRVGIIPHISAGVAIGRALASGLPITYLERPTLGEALETHYETPALFCSYYIEGEEKLPRLAKKDERLIQSKGGQVFVSLLAVDYDRPKVDGKKSPWENSEEPWELLARLAETPELWPTVYYSTKNGARLIYVLTRSITTHEAGQAYVKLLDRLRAVGIEGDDNTKDWTRFFVLPFATKFTVDDEGIVTDEEKLWENDTIFCETFEDSLLNPDLLLSETRTFEPCLIDGDQPDSRLCDRLLWKDNKQTPAHRRAKELLKNNSYGAYLFDGHGCDFPSGTRDSKINSMAWSVVRTLYGKRGLEEMGPEFPFAVMQRGVAQMAPDIDEPDKSWVTVLWDKTCRIWEQAVDEHEIESLTDEERDQQVLAGWKMQLAKDGVSLQGLMATTGIDSDVKLMKRYLILISSKGELFLLNQHGDYNVVATPNSGLHGAIEGMGLSRMYGLEEFGQRVSEGDLKREHGFPINEIVGELGAKSGRLSGLDTEHTKLHIPTYYRIEREPLFVPEVDEWLKVFAGDKYERLIDWLGHAQDPPRPICALSLTGGPGSGKTFFGELLGHCFGPGMKNGSQIFGQWNFRLRDNPVIHLDEDLGNLKGITNIDARFREFVTGGNFTLSQRHVDERSYEVYPRVIISANDLEALQHLVAGRDLADDSHAALAERLLHIDVDEDARKLLTRDMTENWIRGDELALRHFAWLYEKRTRPSLWAGGGRFLVEGDRESEVLEESRFSSPVIEAVQQALVKIVESSGNVAAGAEVKDGVVIASATRISDMMKKQSHDFYNITKSPKAIGAALKKLSNAQGESNPVRLWHVPVEILLRYAIETGAPCDRLRQVYAEAYGEQQLKALQTLRGIR